MKLYKNQTGIAHLLLIVLTVVVLGVVGYSGWRVYNSKKKPTSQSATTASETKIPEGFEEYRNDKLRLKFIYPVSWQIQIKEINEKIEGAAYYGIDGVLTSPTGKQLIVSYYDVGGGGGDCEPKETDKPFDKDNECPSLEYLFTEKLNPLSAGESAGLTNNRYIVHSKYRSPGEETEYRVCLDNYSEESAYISKRKEPAMGFVRPCSYFAVGLNVYYKVASEAEFSSAEVMTVHEIMRSFDTF